MKKNEHHPFLSTFNTGDNEGKKTNWGAATSTSTHNDSFVKIAAGTSTAIALVLFIVCVVIYKLRESR